MEAVFSNTPYLPLGMFLIWYGFVQLSKQVYRLAWIASWEARRRLFRRDRPVLPMNHAVAVNARRDAPVLRRRLGSSAGGETRP